MRTAKSITLTLCTALALGGCANAVKQAAKTADNQAYAAANTSARACPSGSDLGPQYNATVDSTAFNEALFDEAVLHFTNTRRCSQGLNALAADTGLRRAASAHTSDMVQMDFFSHTSPVPGRKTLQSRLNEKGVRYKAAAENLATRSRLKMQSGRQFFVIDRPSCTYSYQQGGEPIQPHSYRSLARQFVEIWEASPEHRTNLLNPRYTRLGTGGGFKDNAKNCGDIVATQNFAA